MQAKDINHNAAKLWIFWNFPHSPLIAKGDLLTPVKPVGCFWLGRLIFRVKDWWSKGLETQKVHHLVEKTLEEMQLQMAKPEPHWHFYISYETCKGGISIRYTYEMLAERILRRSSLTKVESIQQSAQKLKQIFHKIDFTQNIKGISKEDVIWYMISGTTYRFSDIPYRPFDGPSVHRKELEAIVQDDFHPLTHEFFHQVIEKNILGL